jgi:hypothetical protein
VSEQRTSIVQMTEAVRADQHDLQLIQDRIAAKGVLSQRHSNLLRM